MSNEPLQSNEPPQSGMPPAVSRAPMQPAWPQFHALHYREGRAPNDAF
jgi:hypothetical protein